MRRPVLIVSFVATGVLLAAFLTGLGFLHLAPAPTVRRLPLTTLVWVQPLANRVGRIAIADRLSVPDAEAVVMAALDGKRAGRLAMLRALRSGEWGVSGTMSMAVMARLEQLVVDPDAEVSAAARALFSTVDLSLRWSKAVVDPKAVPVSLRPPGPDDWLPGPQAVLGLTVLTHLGAGYDHRMPSRFKRYVEAVVRALVDGQEPSGRFAADDRDHAIVTLALAEAYAMTNDPALKPPLITATAVLLREDEGGPERRWSQDSGLVVWDCMAMKSLAAGGMPHGLMRMDAWRKASSDFGKRWFRHGREVSVGVKDLAAQQGVVGIFLGDTRVTLGLSPSDLEPEFLLSPLTAYWISLACFQVSTDFPAQSQAFRDACRKEQVWGVDPLRNGCLAPDGDPVVNALRCLVFEIFYRFIPVSATKGP